MTAVNHAIFGDPPKRPEKPRPPLRDQFDFTQLEKGHFETSKEYRARITALAVAPIVIGDLTLDSARYDADRQVFPIGAELNRWVKDKSPVRFEDLSIEIAPAGARGLYYDCERRVLAARFAVAAEGEGASGIQLRIGGSVRILIVELWVSAYDATRGQKVEYACRQEADEQHWASALAKAEAEEKIESLDKYLFNPTTLGAHQQEARAAISELPAKWRIRWLAANKAREERESAERKAEEERKSAEQKRQYAKIEEDNKRDMLVLIWIVILWALGLLISLLIVGVTRCSNIAGAVHTAQVFTSLAVFLFFGMLVTYDKGEADGGEVFGSFIVSVIVWGALMFADLWTLSLCCGDEALRRVT